MEMSNTDRGFSELKACLHFKQSVIFKVTPSAS
jgi:hypothetical protein